MPTYVDPNACNACQGQHQGPLCVYICPNDLMVLDQAVNKGFNQEPEMCSECYACVKLCPEEAIHVRGYADFVPMGVASRRAACRSQGPQPLPSGGVLVQAVRKNRVWNAYTWCIRCDNLSQMFLLK